MKVFWSYVTGLMLGALGTVLLNVSLQRILSDDKSADLSALAGVAGTVGVFILGSGLIIVVLLVFVCPPIKGSRYMIAWPVAVTLASSGGVALSLALSFTIMAVFARFLPEGMEWLATILGALLVCAGFMLTRGLWRNVRAYLAAVAREQCRKVTAWFAARAAS